MLCSRPRQPGVFTWPENANAGFLTEIIFDGPEMSLRGFISTPLHHSGAPSYTDTLTYTENWQDRHLLVAMQPSSLHMSVAFRNFIADPRFSRRLSMM